VELLTKLSANVSTVILGKAEQITFASLAFLTGGHILMEDVPGVGKTVLAKSFARSLSAEFKRVQFTPDLLPADVTGTAIFDPRERTFEFKKGPIFTHVLLADEINRASPRTQSALLEGMSEGQVSADGQTWKLPEPFMVLATQNPIDFHGTYPLPEAQLDRFAVRIELGYPSAEVETEMLLAQAGRHPYETLGPVATLEDVLKTRARIHATKVSKSVAGYMVDVGRALRKHPQVRLGVSPRGSLALFRLTQAWAASKGRDFATPDDVKAVAVPVLAHRLVLEPKSKYAGVDPRAIVREVLEQQPVPA
jgi:MoxR-like ATPase